jgi:hypothetical protein
VSSFLNSVITVGQTRVRALEGSANRPPPTPRRNLRIKPTFVRVPRWRRAYKLAEAECEAESSVAA